MKTKFALFTIFIFSVVGCSDNSTTIRDIESKDSISNVVDPVNKTNPSATKNGEDEFSVKKEFEEEMINISECFSSEELEKIRYNLTKQLSFFYWWTQTREDLRGIAEDGIDLGERNETPEDIEISEKMKTENVDAIYRVLSINKPILKNVSQDLFEERLFDVFGINISTKDFKTSFYTNQKMDHEDHYALDIDLKNHIISFAFLPFAFDKEPDWDGLNDRFEKKRIGYYTLEAFDARQKYHKDYLTNAIQEKYNVYCSKSSLEYLFHCNNYVFYDNKASLSWLLTHEEGKSFIITLFEFYNFDKESRINKLMLSDFFKRNDVNKGYPLRTYEYKRLFGEVESCSQIDYYNHFKFKVRTGLMQYIVDNCYDEEDLDDCGLKKDKYICVMEDCFDYLFKFVLQGDKYKESENCHYYQVCAYLAYYLQKAYDSYLSHNDGEPRCWHNALANNLYQDLRNNDGRFEKYVKDNNYFNLDGFDQIMEDAHEQAMR